MAGDSEIGADGKLWIMPAILGTFGFSSVLKAFDTFDAGKSWHVWVSYATAGTLLTAAGVVWAVFRKKIAELWPWHQLRNTREELAKTLRANLELQLALSQDKPTPKPLLPAPPEARDIPKPPHNVQCVGFKTISDSGFEIACLCFRNVSVPGGLIGKFLHPRLRVVYYDNSTGQEIADMCPLTWWGSDNTAPVEINAEGSCAEVASYSVMDEIWKAFEVNEDLDYTGNDRLIVREFPAGEYRIVVKLIGFYQLHVPVFSGILTLLNDGSSSFTRINP